jgi:hypothetical protein
VAKRSVDTAFGIVRERGDERIAKSTGGIHRSHLLRPVNGAKGGVAIRQRRILPPHSKCLFARANNYRNMTMGGAGRSFYPDNDYHG